MGYDYCGTVFHYFFYRGPDLPFRRSVEIGSGFINDKDRCVFEDGAGDGQPLALTAREQKAIFAEMCVINLGKVHDKLVDLDQPACLKQLLISGLRVGKIEIVTNRRIKEMDLLGDNTHHLPQLPGTIISQFIVTQLNMSKVVFPKAEQQVQGGSFPRAN